MTSAQVTFGLRLWASVVLALFLAYWLQLDNPFWAGTSAGIVCQPSLGASLRKANFRLIGTVLGAVVLVVLIGVFPQNRAGFLFALAVWCGLCGFAATVLQNFGSYGAALAGYTAVIIASDAIGDPNAAFMLAVARASEIGLGIVCAGLVLVLTARGTARAQAASTIATIARETGLGMRATLEAAGGPKRDSAPARRALIARVSALSGLLDETVGESPDLRVRSGTLQAAVDGLFAALSGWRMVATHLESLPPEQAAADAAAALAALPPGPAIVMTARSSPADTRDRCRNAARAMAAQPVSGAGAALVITGGADALLGLARGLNGVALLVEPARAELAGRGATLRPPDLLPALLNGVRAFLIILVISVFWIVTAWPSGPSALVFGAIIVLLLSPRGDSAISNAWGFLFGTLATAGLAAVADFALLPGLEGFGKLALVMGIFLVPLAALSAGNWQKSAFTAMATNFTPLLAPSNLPSYDTAAFYNATLAIGVGVGMGVLLMALVPQLSPPRRVQRALVLTLRDLRRLTTLRRPGSQRAWEAVIYGRLATLPDCASPAARGDLIAALYVGEAMLRLRRGGAGLRAQVARLALQEALARHADYFKKVRK